MDEGPNKQGSESQDSDEPVPPGIDPSKQLATLPVATSSPFAQTSARGVENARRVLRAFAIQKKPLPAPAVVTNIKLGSSAAPSTKVVIGKLASTKAAVKAEKPPDVEKIPKPPKPGQLRKAALENTEELQRKALLEIEHHKRKQEMVDLGIPLGLLCPEHSKKAVPTKAMPPIKTFLDNEKVDEIIKEAKKAKAEGKEFKFDYNKFVPDYNNPFQRKYHTDEKDDSEWRLEQMRMRQYTKEKKSSGYSIYDRNKELKRGRDSKRDKRDSTSSRDTSRDDKYKDKDKRSIDKESKSINKDNKSSDNKTKDGKSEAEAKVNLNDYLVCDSWSLDNEDRTSISSPQVDKVKLSKDKLNSPSENPKNTPSKSQMSPIEPIKGTKADLSPMGLLKANLAKQKATEQSPKKDIMKIEKLQPVIDSFKFEIDDDDDVLDIFDEKSNLDKFGKPTIKKELQEDAFLESVINEIGEEDKGLVEYESPKESLTQGSATPDMEDSYSVNSVRSDNSDGWRSTESRKSIDSFKSSDTGYKSSETVKSKTDIDKIDVNTKKSDKKDEGKSKSSDSCSKASKTDSKSDKSVKKVKDRRDRSLTVDKDCLADEISRCTVESLQTWSFVLKICQPILFRHDRNKCYKETRCLPKMWYTENPKVCNCVKDRGVVYEELETCKLKLIDQVYRCNQFSEHPLQTTRPWYPKEDSTVVETLTLDNETISTDLEGRKPADDVSNEWEADDTNKACTPEKEVSLDTEYEKFMQAVWPEVADVSTESSKASRSTTPQRQERKKKLAQDVKEQKKGAKKMKIAASQDWSQESEPEEVEKSKKRKKKQLESLETKSKDKTKVRKRKLSPSALNSSVSSDDETRKRKKIEKKTAAKKAKQDKAKRRRLEKKMLKKLDAKKKKKLKDATKEESILEESIEKETKKKDKKVKKKVQKVKKRADKKKKRARSSSSSSSSGSDESDVDKKKKKKKKKDVARKKKKLKKKKKKRRESSSSSSDSEELFDVNILNNIKTERVEPLRPPREIINVHTLQDDFTTLKVKQEKEEEQRREQQKAEQRTESQLPSENNEKAERVVEETSEPQHLEEKRDNAIEQRKELLHQVEKREITIERVPKSQGKLQEVEEKKIDERIEKKAYIQDNRSETVSHEVKVSEDTHEEIETDTKSKHYPTSPQSTPVPEYNTTPTNYANDYTKDAEFGDNYEMYEQMAMEYQSDVAKLISPPVGSDAPVQRIETVVQLHNRGEIKCDWRPTDEPVPPSTTRPSRWGLKPSEVNIVLTGDDPPQTEPVYRIQCIATSRNETTGYDEAYEDMYGASDRLQYGDCFESSGNDSTGNTTSSEDVNKRPSLDARINTVLAEAKQDEIVKSMKSSRVVKRVSFADGYKPGQDSDVEEPPIKKRSKPRRCGTAWPCPVSHPDHVALWDALPPPPPPPGSPPPPAPPHGPPLHLLRQYQQAYNMPGIGAMPANMSTGKDGPLHMMKFMPPEPPPGLISFT